MVSLDPARLEQPRQLCLGTTASPETLLERVIAKKPLKMDKCSTLYKFRTQFRPASRCNFSNINMYSDVLFHAEFNGDGPVSVRRLEVGVTMFSPSFSTFKTIPPSPPHSTPLEPYTNGFVSARALT